MPLIDCKVELELKWTKYCVFSAGGTENMMLKILDILSKTTKLYLPIVPLSARDNQKLSKLLSKGFEWSVYWNEYKTKSENKNTTNEFRYFLESNFITLNRLFVLVYTNEGKKI